MNKLRILQIIDGLRIGGAEMLMVDLAHYLISVGHQVQVAYSTEGPVAEKLKVMGVPIVRLSHFSRIDPIFTLRIANVIQSYKPNVVHTHLFKSDFHGRLVAYWMGVPVVVSTVHNNDDWIRFAPLGWLYGRTSIYVDRIIAVSDEVRDYHIKHTFLPPQKIITINNGIDLKRFKDLGEAGLFVREKLNISADTPLIGIVGRLSPQKDHTTFLNAAALIGSAFPSARFLVVGDGPMRNHLEEEVHSLGLGEIVIFCGVRDDIPAVLAALDILVFSSRWEGLPLTLLEGMAAAKPIITTSVGGIPGVVRNDVSALIVPPSDPLAISNAVLRILKNPELGTALGKAAQKHVINNYSIDNMLQSTLSVYEDIWNNVKNSHT